MSPGAQVHPRGKRVSIPTYRGALSRQVDAWFAALLGDRSERSLDDLLPWLRRPSDNEGRWIGDETCSYIFARFPVAVSHPRWLIGRDLHRHAVQLSDEDDRPSRVALRRVTDRSRMGPHFEDPGVLRRDEIVASVWGSRSAGRIGLWGKRAGSQGYEHEAPGPPGVSSSHGARVVFFAGRSVVSSASSQRLPRSECRRSDPCRGHHLLSCSGDTGHSGVT